MGFEGNYYFGSPTALFFNAELAVQVLTPFLHDNKAVVLGPSLRFINAHTVVFD